MVLSPGIALAQHSSICLEDEMRAREEQHPGSGSSSALAYVQSAPDTSNMVLQERYEQQKGQLLQNHLSEQHKMRQRHVDRIRQVENTQSTRRNSEAVSRAQEVADLKVDQVWQQATLNEHQQATTEIERRHSLQGQGSEFEMRHNLAQLQGGLDDEWDCLMLQQARDKDDLAREYGTALRAAVQGANQLNVEDA